MATQVAAGTLHGIALLHDSTVVCWGGNNYGESNVPSDLPPVTFVAAGGYFSIAITDNGEIRVWGDNGSGQRFAPSVTNAVQADGGNNHAAAVLNDGTVVCWGDNGYGQCDVPAGLSGVIAVGCGSAHTTALKSDGTVVCWGYDNQGQSTPPAGLSGVQEIAVSHSHNLALLDDGSVVGWGWDNYGQLSIPAGISATSIATNQSFSLAALSDGTATGWGYDFDDRANPPGSLTGIVAVAAGNNFGLAKNEIGEVFGWGPNTAAATPPDSVQPPLYLDATLSFEVSISGAMAAQGPIESTLGFTADIELEVFSAGPLDAGLGFSADIDAEQKWKGMVSAGLGFSGDVRGYQNWTEALNLSFLQEVYRLIITGSPDGVDDLVIGGISSWQATNQADGRSSYLQAVIPAVDGVIDELAARENGELIIQKGYRFEDGSERYEEILRSEFDTFRWDRGPSRFTATVSGYLAGKIASSGKRPLTGIRSLTMTNGKHRTRCDIDLFLQPGMMVVADDVTFQAGYINYYVNQTDKFCEVGER